MIAGSIAKRKQPQASVEQQVPPEVPDGNDPSGELIPICGLGCMICFGYLDMPACLGFKLGGDCCCLTTDIDFCRVICEDSNEGTCFLLIV